ncbi:methyltransferase [Burkholderia pseudomallei]|nr:methyltransferase [Burkholderia pseudomallei]
MPIVRSRRGGAAMRRPARISGRFRRVSARATAAIGSRQLRQLRAARGARRPARDRRAACLASRRRGSRPAARAGAFTPGGHASSASRRGERARAPARRGRPATPRFVTRFVARFSTRKQPLSARRTCLVDTAFTPHSRHIHAAFTPKRAPRAADPGQSGLPGPVS